PGPGPRRPAARARLGLPGPAVRAKCSSTSPPAADRRPACAPPWLLLRASYPTTRTTQRSKVGFFRILLVLDHPELTQVSLGFCQSLRVRHAGHITQVLFRVGSGETPAPGHDRGTCRQRRESQPAAKMIGVLSRCRVSVDDVVRFAGRPGGLRRRDHGGDEIVDMNEGPR